MISNTWFLFDDCSFTIDNPIQRHHAVPQEWFITSFTTTNVKENAEFCHIARRRRWRGHSDYRVHVIYHRKYSVVLLIETENNLQNVILTFSENCGPKLPVELKCVHIILPCKWCQHDWTIKRNARTLSQNIMWCTCSMFSICGAVIPYHCEEGLNGYVRKIRCSSWDQSKTVKDWVMSEMVHDYRHIIIQRVLAAAKVLGTELATMEYGWFWSSLERMVRSFQRIGGWSHKMNSPPVAGTVANCFSHFVNCKLNRVSRWILRSISFIRINFYL